MATRSRQVPLLRHRSGAQSSTFTSQRSPEEPTGQNDENISDETKRDTKGLTRKSVGALAPEGVGLVEAGAVVEARGVGALVHVHVAVAARPARLAQAAVVADQVGAGRRVGAAQRRRQSALVHVRLAVAPFESGRAEARVVGQAVEAGGAVEARRRVAALVHLLAAILAGEPRAVAGAAEAAHQVGARPVVPARIRLAVVHVGARASGESGQAHALVRRLGPRLATRVGRARDVGAAVDWRRAARPAEARKAQALDSAAVAAAAADSVVEARVGLASGGRLVSQHPPAVLQRLDTQPGGRAQLALVAAESGGALADVAGETVEAGAAVLASVQQAVVDLGFAPVALVTGNGNETRVE